MAVLEAEKEFSNDMSSLAGVLDMVEDFARSARATEGLHRDLKLVAEELFTNFVRHNRGGRPSIGLRMVSDGSDIDLTLKQEGVEKPSIPAPGSVETQAPIEDRRPGGLGVHLVRALVEGLEYDYSDRTLTVTATLRAG
jgi:anti-sigma regulatory factor (Ser/Thr protein kinase)